MLKPSTKNEKQSDAERIKELEEGYSLLLSKFRLLEKLVCKTPCDLGEIDYHFFTPKDASDEIDF